MKLSKIYGNVKSAIACNKAAMAQADRKAAGLAAIAMVGVLSIAPDLAMAAPWDSAAGQVLSMFTGGMARTIAIIAVIACGIASLAGKLSWDWAIKIVIGIILIFGGAPIVDYFISGTGG